MQKKGSRRRKEQIEKKTEKEQTVQAFEPGLRERLDAPMTKLRFACAIDMIQAKLRLIDADLAEQKGRQLIRSMTSRIKTSDSIVKKLSRKERSLTYENAVNTLNDIGGVRVVCYFCDDIYAIADMIKQQSDIRICKVKDYVANPKQSGYQSIHLIVGVPVTYKDETREVRVEIQIRTFAMDYWAQLDTQMCYKKSAGQLENVERQIKDYSDVMAKVDNKMLELRRQIEKM